MSSCPGYTMEDFLSWCYNLTVEDQEETNVSIGIAEMLGNIPQRPHLSKENFAPIVAKFEEHREQIERYLNDYSEEENGSWRDYAGAVFGFISDELDQWVTDYVKMIVDVSTYLNEMSRREMILFNFRRGTDFSNPMFFKEPPSDIKLPLSKGWHWSRMDSGYYVAVSDKGEFVTKEDVEQFKNHLLNSVQAIQSIQLPIDSYITEEQKVEYITKETLATIRPFINTAHGFKNLADCIALISTHYAVTSSPQEEFVRSRISTLLRDTASIVLSGPIDYFTGNGPVARYLKEHLAVERIMENEQGHIPARLGEIRCEIDEKFNFNPSIDFLSIEWKNIIGSLIELESRYLKTDEDASEPSIFIPISNEKPIMKSGFYRYPNNSRAIHIVFELNGLRITITLLENENPIISVFHPWEESMQNVYGICYFQGMYAAIMNEVTTILSGN